jgi:CubicO group peptidase (beta-lactamase class C family)
MLLPSLPGLRSALFAVVAAGLPTRPFASAFHEFRLAILRITQSTLNSLDVPATIATTPGSALVVRKNYQTILTICEGLSTLRTTSPVTPQTNFRLASCTKLFTAAAVILLARGHQATYDQSISEFLPKFPHTQITIRHLLHHTSGLPDYEPLMNPAIYGAPGSCPPQKQITDPEVLALLRAQRKTNFAPGAKFAYSNAGYVLLGLIVEAISRQPFEDFLQERMFEPLKMRNTLMHVKGKNQIANRAYGYTRRGNLFDEVDQSCTSATRGDGGLYSNLEDLEKWDDALTTNKLLTGEEFHLATSPQKNSNLVPAEELPFTAPDAPHCEGPCYGFGWFLNPDHPHPHHWHYGETAGFRSAIMRFPRDRVTTILLSNLEQVAAPAIALQAAQAHLIPRP